MSGVVKSMDAALKSMNLEKVQYSYAVSWMFCKYQNI